MSGLIHTKPVQHPSAWYGKDLANDRSWLVHLSSRDLQEIADAVNGVKSHNLALAEVGRGSFPLPTLAEKLAAHLEEIRSGRGFVVLRGLNAADYSDEDVGLIFWAIGAYLGAQEYSRQRTVARHQRRHIYRHRLAARRANHRDTAAIGER